MCRGWRQKRSCGEAEEAKTSAVGGFGGFEHEDFLGGVFGWPVRGVGAPREVVVGEDEAGSGQVTGRADDLGAAPAKGAHDALAEVDVLDRVAGEALLDDVSRPDALVERQNRHGVGFDDSVVSGSAGHDEMGGDAGAVLADPFEDALALLGRGRAIGEGRRAEHDERVEVGLLRVVPWNSAETDRDGDDGKQKQAENGERNEPGM